MLFILAYVLYHGQNQGDRHHRMEEGPNAIEPSNFPEKTHLWSDASRGPGLMVPWAGKFHAVPPVLE